MTLLADNDVVATTITLQQLASIGVAVFVPLLVGLVTKKSTNPTVKALLLIALSAVNSFLTEYLTSDNFRLDQALLGAVVLWVVGTASHFSLMKPTGLTEAAQNAFGGGNPPPPLESERV